MQEQAQGIYTGQAANDSVALQVVQRLIADNVSLSYSNILIELKLVQAGR